ncbi:MAG: type II toxin-antitoxin system RelE/ParE family toxin [bacterium]
MILNFKCKETEKIYEGIVSLELPGDIQHVARRKLRILNNAKKLNDLMITPSNCLEVLKGFRKDEYSIRVNKQWRVCFTWENGHVCDVKIEDYH